MTLLSNLTEDFLYYVWRDLHFEFRDLRTTDGQAVQIIKTGLRNPNSGPDFLQAHLKISGLSWFGQVEMHMHAGDWYKHKHQDDPAYNNVILHVVLHSDGQAILRQDGTPIPEVVLNERIPPRLLHTYHRLQLAQEQIPCQANLPQIAPFHVNLWLQRTAIERMEQKAAAIQNRLNHQIQNWEQICWEEMAAFMGGTVNQEAFRLLAQRIPAQIWKLYVHDQEKTEALLFGGSGLLRGKMDGGYWQHLRQSWAFLAHKHQLDDELPIAMKFLRMRPAAFPTIRLSQLAHLLFFFRQLTPLLEKERMKALLKAPIEASSYWQTHYRFGVESAARSKKLGKSHKQVLLINVLLPLAVLYHRAHGRSDIGDLIEDVLTGLPPEANRLTRAFTDLDISCGDALVSQGMVQLHKHYCAHKRCLDCGIGQRLLR
ncbi:MAG: DUF2851 family protein [Bacteroidota bacterium]